MSTEFKAIKEKRTESRTHVVNLLQILKALDIIQPIFLEFGKVMFVKYNDKNPSLRVQ